LVFRSEEVFPVWLAIDGQVRGAHDRIVDAGKIVEVPEKVAVVREIFRLAGQGVGSTNIIHQLNERVLSRAWVIRTLNNRAVLGEFQPIGCEVIQGYYPQIITQSEFDAARAQIKTKVRNGKYAGGNRTKSYLAENLFESLMFDITTEPVRSMHFQRSRQYAYAMSAFDKGGRPSNRIRYDKLEKAILGFLNKADWQAIAGESESDEYRTANAALEAILRQIDVISLEIVSNTEAVQGEDVDTRRQFMRENAKHEALLTTLIEKKDALQSTVESAQAKSADLAETKTFRELLNQLDSKPALRLPLKAVIQKKVSRIELVFMPRKKGVSAIIQYSNGALGLADIYGQGISDEYLRARGSHRIQRTRQVAITIEIARKQLLEVAHKLA
jgi:Recombinase